MSPWNRTRLAVACLVLAGVPAMARAQDSVKASKPAEAKKSTAFDPIEITISPSPATVPALKYRLLPMESDRTPGDAAPIYIRACLGLTEKDEAHEKVNKWVQLPPGQLPLDEARKFIDQQRGRLEQLAFGARRQACQWSYTLREQSENAVELLLPDVQAIRHWQRVLQIKASVEIAEKKYGDAIRTMETGIAMGRHVGEGPFIINTLVAAAFANVMLARVDELIAQPGAPNLYWALSSLPQPLIGIRSAMETEQRIGERMVPEITDLDRPRTEAEWSSLLVHLHARLMRVQKNAVAINGTLASVGQDRTLAEFRTDNLAEARTFYKNRKSSTEGMSDDQILVRFVGDRYRELRDDWYKFAYLPYPDLVRFHTPQHPEETHKKGPMAFFAALMPSSVHVKMAEARTDRKVAALRIIEALRMHAAKDGTLPESLDAITLVSIPLDPVTGKAFSYTRTGAGETATLSAPPPSSGQPGLTYHITLRK
jgi:hypothetical protein